MCELPNRLKAPHTGALTNGPPHCKRGGICCFGSEGTQKTRRTLLHRGREREQRPQPGKHSGAKVQKAP
jgi:hypothetical protein